MSLAERGWGWDPMSCGHRRERAAQTFGQQDDNTVLSLALVVGG